ncbi:hypothetical protein K504DRAFT_461831 [Pleomassaria siparia CBS 279.74]|uniref:Uncharacterized protein n=1 Tax=Pleomassaria siparia CBS 279.74 TaxID=1314801 RepID=A0A6G1KKF9_9PLEO|nr:hypothetical protein K504DRAFT_461831 [Pleomassaria siparia CBS 279.74]
MDTIQQPGALSSISCHVHATNKSSIMRADMDMARDFLNGDALDGITRAAPCAVRGS